MSSVRSKRLAAGTTTSTASWSTVYTVPTGYTTIVKQIYYYNFSAAAIFPSFAVLLAGGGQYDVLRYPSLAAGTLLQIPLWLCLEAGDSFQLYENVAGDKFYISGAELIGI